MLKNIRVLSSITAAVKMNIIYISCLFALTFFFDVVQSTKVNNCTGTPALLPEVDILDCEAPPCVFYIGKSGHMSITFRAPRYIEKFQPKAVANVFNMDIPYPLNQDDGCVGVTNTPCPLAEGELVEYSYAMEILTIFPEASIVLEFSLIDLDQNKEPFICFKVNLELSKE